MKKVCILGLGKSGYSTLQYLINKGISKENVFVSEKKNTIPEEIKSFLDDNKIDYELGKNSEKILQYNQIILSPGIPKNIPILQEAQKRNIEIINDVELFYRDKQDDAIIIGITGTNGKTTITHLISFILNTFGKTFMGGNVGIPILEYFKEKEYKYCVIELSSFQLEAIDSFRPHIAIISNISPDHMDRYNSFEDYMNAKFNILKNSTPNDYFVYDKDEKIIKKKADEYSLKKIEVSLNKKTDIYFDRSIESIIINNKKFPIQEVKLVGEHNIQNILLSLGVVKALNLDIETAFDAITKFKGVEHRIEFIGEFNNVYYYNDSKATTVESVKVALRSFPNKKIIWLGGGKDKNLDFSSLKEELRNVKYAIFFGQDGQKLQKVLGKYVENTYVKSLKDAVIKAMQIAAKEDIVLLSPGCTSFDEFSSYVERGEMFKKWVYQYATN